MASYYHTNQVVFKLLKDFFDNKFDAPIDREALILNIITKYPIGDRKVREHIDHFYIERNLVSIKNGVLYPVVKEKAPEAAKEEEAS